LSTELKNELGQAYFFFTGIVLGIRDEDKMDESSSDELFKRKDVRRKKEKKRSHKQNKDEITKESFKKMREEIDELRKNEHEKNKELEKLKKKLEMQELGRVVNNEEENALGFDRTEYLNKGFIESAQWIKNVIAKNMLEKMNHDDQKEKFVASAIVKRASTHMGLRTCARYNRGETCMLGKCHSTYQAPYDARHRINQGTADLEQSQSDPRRRNEMRLHACNMEIIVKFHRHSYNISILLILKYLILFLFLYSYILNTFILCIITFVNN